MLVGLNMRCGSNVDAIRPLFRRVNDDGTLGATFAGDHHGGGGGDHGGEYSINNHVVTGLIVHEGARVDRIQVVFREWLGSGQLGAVETLSNPCGGGGGNPKDLRAPASHVLVGIHGRSGRVIDRIGTMFAKTNNGVSNEKPPVPKTNELVVDAYPNPFREQMTIRVRAENPGNYSVALYNVLGQLIETKENWLPPHQEWTTTWQTSDLPAGLYIVSVSNEKGRLLTKHVTHIK